jgi:hypothetical protein
MSLPQTLVLLLVEEDISTGQNATLHAGIARQIIDLGAQLV